MCLDLEAVLDGDTVDHASPGLEDGMDVGEGAFKDVEGAIDLHGERLDIWEVRGKEEGLEEDAFVAEAVVSDASLSFLVGRGVESEAWSTRATSFEVAEES